MCVSKGEYVSHIRPRVTYVCLHFTHEHTHAHAHTRAPRESITYPPFDSDTLTLTLTNTHTHTHTHTWGREGECMRVWVAVMECARV